MKIYSKGFSDKNIDYIVERKLRAIITKEYAIVTIADDKRLHDELRTYFEVSEDKTEESSIFFSPEMLVPDLQYILLDEQEQIDTSIRIQEFKESFFALVRKLAEQSGDLTRAEVIRLIWQKFSSGPSTPYSNVDEEKKERLLSRVVTADDEKWIIEKFVELILKYAIYLTCWEKAYGSLAVRRYNENHLGTRVSLDDKEAGMMAHENTINNWFRYLFEGDENPSVGNIPESVKEVFEKNKLESVARCIEENVYKQCKIQIDRNADIYRNFFYSSHGAKVNGTNNNKERVKATLYELILFTNCFAFSWNMSYARDKVVEFILDETEHIGDIGKIIDKNTTAAVEIVLMNTVKVNQNLGEDKNWVDLKVDKISCAVESANKLQLYVIPAALVLLDANENKDNIPVENLLERLHKEDDLKTAVESKAEERKVSLKKKDGGNALGKLHVFASENEAVTDIMNVSEEAKKSEKKALIVNRTKSIERNYWTQRKRTLSTYKVTGVNGSDDLVRKYLEYLHWQNKVVRDYVREVIDFLINSEGK